MVISDSEKKVLLERLALARAAKQAKKKAPAAEPVAPPAPAPAPAPAPEPEPVAPTPAVPAVPAVPDVPDLVAKAKKPKKATFEDTDSDEPILPPKIKKGAKKESAYMKIKIYREPKNTAAFQDLLAAVQDTEEEAPAPAPAPEPEPEPVNAAPRMIRVPANKSIIQAKVMNNDDYNRRQMLRQQALSFFA